MSDESTQNDGIAAVYAAEMRLLEHLDRAKAEIFEHAEIIKTELLGHMESLTHRIEARLLTEFLKYARNSESRLHVFEVTTASMVERMSATEGRVRDFIEEGSPSKLDLVKMRIEFVDRIEQLEKNLLNSFRASTQPQIDSGEGK